MLGILTLSSSSNLTRIPLIQYDTEADKHLVIQLADGGVVKKISEGSPAFATIWQLPASGTPGFNAQKQDLVWFFNPDNKQVTAGIRDRANTLVPVFFSKNANDRKIFVSTDYVPRAGVRGKDGVLYQGVELVFE